MFKVSRIEEIKKLLSDDGQVNVGHLCEIFGVSSVTIRNDLKLLEREGFLIRTHGGAVPREGYTGPVNDPPDAFDAEAVEKRKKIAEVAAKHIKDGMWIYLSSGRTCYEIGKKLLDRSLNIVTGGLNTAIELSNSKSIEILIPGGNLVRGNNFAFLAGDWFLRSLDEMRFDQAYVGVSGVDLKSGFTVNNSLEFRLIEKIKSVSIETIVIADSTKFGHRSFMPVADLTYANTVITNSDIPDEYREYFEKHHINLITD